MCTAEGDGTKREVGVFTSLVTMFVAFEGGDIKQRPRPEVDEYSSREEFKPSGNGVRDTDTEG